MTSTLCPLVFVLLNPSSLLSLHPRLPCRSWFSACPGPPADTPLFTEAGCGVTAETPPLLRAGEGCPEDPDPVRLGEGHSFHVCPRGARIL